MSLSRVRLFAPHRIVGAAGLLVFLSVAIFYRDSRSLFSSVVSPSVRRQAVASPSPSAGASPTQTEVFGASVNDAENVPHPLIVSKKTLPAFTVTNLADSLAPDKRVALTALSNTGAVLATIYDPPPPRLPNGRPARRPASPAYVARFEKKTWKRFPIPAKAEQVIAGDINDLGDIVAVSVRFRRGKPSYNRLILYLAATDALLDVGTLDPRYADPDPPDFDQMRGVGEAGATINNRGLVSAMVGDTSWVRYRNGRVVPVADAVIGDCNDNNVAVGFGRGSGGTPILWRDLSAARISPPQFLVPARNGAGGVSETVLRGIPQCVNNRGQAVLAVTLETNNGFRRQGLTAYHLIRNRKMRQIGSFSGFQSFRARINDVGDVVGFSETKRGENIPHPFLYRGGELYNISDAAGQAWQIVGAVDINNRGQILAYGVRKNAARSYPAPILLTPPVTPAPKTATVRRPN